MSERKTDEFEVVTDNGRSFVIHELTEESGTKRYVTSVGIPVKCEGLDFLIGRRSLSPQFVRSNMIC